MSMDRKSAHQALDRLIDAAEQDADWKSNHRDDLNDILRLCEPLFRTLWDKSATDKAASGDRIVIIRMVQQMRSAFPKDTWANFLIALTGLEIGCSNALFEPKPPLKRKGWANREKLPRMMGTVVIWWSETLTHDDKKLGIDRAVTRACEIFAVERNTPYRWIKSIENAEKEEIRHIADRWLAERPKIDQIGELFEGHNVDSDAIIAAVEGGSLVQLLYAIFSISSTSAAFSTLGRMNFGIDDSY